VTAASRSERGGLFYLRCRNSGNADQTLPLRVAQPLDFTNI
jgi:hypothetical protein